MMTRSLSLFALLTARLSSVVLGDHAGESHAESGYDEGYHHMHAEGYYKIAENFTVDGVPVQQISGLCNNVDGTQVTYYAISDAVGETWSPMKPIYVVSFVNTHMTTTFSGVDTIPLDLPYDADTESIAFLQEYNNSHADAYFLIASEGDRDTDQSTNFWIFDYNGTYVGNLSYNHCFKMTETSGFQDGAGPEALSVTPNHEYVVWIASDTLLQDSACASEGCVRIVVQQVTYGHHGPSWTEVAQFRYDKDTDVREGGNTTVTDVTLVEDDLSEILVLEKTVYYNDAMEMKYHTKAYTISLAPFFSNSSSSSSSSHDDSDMGHSHMRRSRRRRSLLDHHESSGDDLSMYDISDCFELSMENCSNYHMVIDKNLTSNFDYDINKTIGFQNDYHVDTISYAEGNPGICESDAYRFVLGATDSTEGQDTYLFYLCYHYLGGHSDHSHGDDHSMHDNGTNHTHGDNHTHTHDHDDDDDDDGEMRMFAAKFAYTVVGIALIIAVKF